MKPNLEDGRSKCVWLTQTGRAFRDQAITNLAEDLMRIAPKLDIEEVMGLLPTLAKVRSVLDEDRN